MAKKIEKKKEPRFVLLPVFVIVAVIVFSVVFSVFLIPLTSFTAGSDLKSIFIILLIYSSTVAAAVSLIFYLIFAKKI